MTDDSTAPVAPQAPARPRPATRVSVEGLPEALQQARASLAFVGPAGRFHVANLRMVLLRNALIALAVVLVLVGGVVVAVHEAYRPTMTIAAFDVPPSLEARGLSGQVLAKALFDELIRRRALVTTLDSGDLKGAWAENRVDVAIPQAGFTLQSLFRYLRYATGNELSIDGEIVLDGDNATLKVRVAGKPPTVAKGLLADWERLVGDLAGGVLEVTQPAVHAAWLGQQARTPADLAGLSRHLRGMQRANPPHGGAVMSVAYDAYGSALQRLDRSDDALRAFDEALNLDPGNGVAVINAARARFDRRDFAEAAQLYQRAQSMKLPDAVKAAALRNRIFGATNTGDCDAAATALADAKRSPLYQPWEFVNNEAMFTAWCEFEEARAIALISGAHALHPEDAGLANTYAVLQMRRPEFRYREQGFEIARAAIAAGVEDRFVYGNFWGRLVEAGRFEEAEHINSRRERLYTAPGALERLRAASGPFLYLMCGEYAKADEGFTRRFNSIPAREESHFVYWARVKTGLGQHDQAFAILRDGLKLLPRNCVLWQELG